jgi:hypothetical protein
VRCCSGCPASGVLSVSSGGRGQSGLGCPTAVHGCGSWNSIGAVGPSEFHDCARQPVGDGRVSSPGPDETLTACAGSWRHRPRAPGVDGKAPGVECGVEACGVERRCPMDTAPDGRAPGAASLARYATNGAAGVRTRFLRRQPLSPGRTVAPSAAAACAGRGRWRQCKMRFQLSRRRSTQRRHPSGGSGRRHPCAPDAVTAAGIRRGHRRAPDLDARPCCGNGHRTSTMPPSCVCADPIPSPPTPNSGVAIRVRGPMPSPAARIRREHPAPDLDAVTRPRAPPMPSSAGADPDIAIRLRGPRCRHLPRADAAEVTHCVGPDIAIRLHGSPMPSPDRAQPGVATRLRGIPKRASARPARCRRTLCDPDPTPRPGPRRPRRPASACSDPDAGCRGRPNLQWWLP